MIEIRSIQEKYLWVYTGSDSKIGLCPGSALNLNQAKLAPKQPNFLKLGDACDRYVVKLEGESPLRTQERRTVREGKGVYREVESEESRIQNADLTNRKCI